MSEVWHWYIYIPVLVFYLALGLYVTGRTMTAAGGPAHYDSIALEDTFPIVCLTLGWPLVVLCWLALHIGDTPLLAPLKLGMSYEERKNKRAGQITDEPIKGQVLR